MEFLEIFFVLLLVAMLYGLGAIVHYAVMVLLDSGSKTGGYSIYQKPYGKNFIRWIARTDDEAFMINVFIIGLISLFAFLMFKFTAGTLAILAFFAFIICVAAVVRHYAEKFEAERNEE